MAVTPVEKRVKGSVKQPKTSGRADFEINPTGVTTSSIPVIYIAQKILIQCNNDLIVFILLNLIFGKYSFEFHAKFCS